MRACLARSDGPLGPGLAAMRGVLSPPPPREPVPEPDERDDGDGREVEDRPLRGYFDLEAPEPAPAPESSSPPILARPRRRRRASGAIAFRMPAGNGKVVLRATVTDEVKTVVLSLEDEHRRERGFVVLGPGKLGVLVSLLGGLALLAGTQLDLGSIHAPARVPLAWSELDRRRSR